MERIQGEVKISVITASYNRRETIAQSLESLFTQSYKAVESVVIDGGSTDGTREIIESYKSKLGYYVSEKDRGLYDALNKGLAAATGDVVGFLHSDDLYESEDVLGAIAKEFADPEVDAVYGDLLYVDANDTGKVVRYWRAGDWSERRLRRGWMPPHPTLYVRRKIYGELGFFNCRYKIAADYDLMLRLLTRGSVIVAYVPKVFVRMRLGGASNGTLVGLVRKMREDLDIARKNQIGGPEVVLLKNLRKISQFWVR